MVGFLIVKPVVKLCCLKPFFVLSYSSGVSQKKVTKCRKSEFEKSWEVQNACFKNIKDIEQSLGGSHIDFFQPLRQPLDRAFLLGAKASDMPQLSLEYMAIKHPLFFCRSTAYCE